MPCEARLKKYRKIEGGPQKLNFGLKTRGWGAQAPGTPLDQLVHWGGGVGLCQRDPPTGLLPLEQRPPPYI